MFAMAASALAVVLALFSISTSVQAQIDSTPAPEASTFYLEKTETQFSINIAHDSSDVYLYFASPAYSWVGFGFGQQMEDSLMLIMYPDADGNSKLVRTTNCVQKILIFADVTISPRVGRKGGEPVFTKNVEIEVLDGTRIENDMMILHARCSDCRVWPNGYLDATSTDQPMIYAFGSAYALQSSSPSADLKRHVRYGHFTMDITAATGRGGVPLKSNASNGVQMQGGLVKDADRKTLAHALLGCLVIFVLWPLNVLIAGFMKNIRIHVGFSLTLIICLGVAYGVGIATSNQYNRVGLLTLSYTGSQANNRSQDLSTRPTRSSPSSLWHPYS
jgi:hypothetical protein